MVLRADSAYYGADVIAAARRHRAHFSVTARTDRAVTTAIGAIAEDAWTAIHYPRAVFDDQLRQWASGSPTPRSPRCRSPRSPPAARTGGERPG